MRGNDGSNVQEATEGDSFDDAPTWVRGEEYVAVYQTAGLARDRGGYLSGLGPFAIERINFKTGEMHTLCQSNDFDFLQPQLEPRASTPRSCPSFQLPPL